MSKLAGSYRRTAFGGPPLGWRFRVGLVATILLPALAMILQIAGSYNATVVEVGPCPVVQEIEPNEGFSVGDCPVERAVTERKVTDWDGVWFGVALLTVLVVVGSRMVVRERAILRDRRAVDDEQRRPNSKPGLPLVPKRRSGPRRQ